ncbi:S8 family serine peptidase [Alkaliphilus pronyensis]|uniref:S8 family serine peptidase n=1 Tax=Alkaliphilus pronyensis TaxID=1482732 RepID=A0A6I0F4Y1_9FIRM|nr:S8 family serine peptidase [Alkaliphilus pronyensis]KAB3534749.1 S8 family serine peptidase [Alkaliphilus pronyensis]
MKNKKLLSALLVLLLVVSSFSFAFANETPKEIDEEVYFQYVRNLRRSEAEKGALLERLNPKGFLGENSKRFNPDEKVRIIVELYGGSVEGPAIMASQIDVSEKLSIQSEVISDVEGNVNIKTRHQFVQGFYGFSADTEYKNLEELKSQKNVKRVYIAEKFTLDMSNSRKIVNTEEIVALEGLYGDGTLIAVLDTGVDPNHKDWEMLEDVDVKITPEKFNEIAKKTEVAEKYYNSKIPTGFDWADYDNDVTGYASDHGIHVAGTAAGNGTIKGIAPNAQILAEKVFSDTDEYAYEDDIIAGIIHAVNFNADVINMSLGSTAAFLDPEIPYHQAISYAVENGVIVAVSAGNSNFSTAVGWNEPYVQNPDVGLVGSPGLWYDTIQVASYENDYVTAYYMDYGDDKKTQYTNSGPDAITYFDKESMELVYAGLGGDAVDFEGKDFKGKIALIQRGEFPFVDKISNAEAHGAAGVIVFNHIDDSLISMMYPEEATIPAVFIGKSAGEELLSMLQDGTAEVTFAGNSGENENINENRMSGFTSWGLTSDLAFKPEITAPGGNIWSLSNNNMYTNMSGTSMAAPHVAGGSALIAQHLKNNHGMADDGDTVDLVKLLLMNTAEIIEDPDNKGLPYSPRRQGAGMMKLDKAVQTPAYVYTEITDDSRLLKVRKNAAVTLRDNVEAEFKLYLSTLDEAEASVPYVVYSSVFEDGKEDNYLTMKTTALQGAELKLLSSTVDKDNTVTGVVYADPETINTLTFKLDLSEADIEDETFVEGFIEFVPLDKKLPTLSVPYVGFYGDWNKPNTIDPAFWNSDTYTEYTGIYDDELINYYNMLEYETDLVIDVIRPDVTLGYNSIGEFNPDWISFSPFTGYKDSAQAIYTILRNAREFNLSIVDEDGNVVKELFDNKTFTNPDDTKPFEEGLRKNVVAATPLTQHPTLFTWDGTDEDNNIVVEGQYYFEVTSKIHYDHITPVSYQYYKMPIKVDLTPIELGNIKVEDNIITWESNGDDIFSFTVFVNGVVAGTTVVNQLTVEGVTAEDNIVVVAEDIAGNASLAYIGDPTVRNEEIFTSIGVNTEAYVSYQRPAEIRAKTSQPVSWKVSIVNPNEEVVAEFSTPDGVYTTLFYESWTPADSYQASGAYKAIFNVKDMEGNETIKEATFNVYNYDVLVNNLSILNTNNEESSNFIRNEMVQVEATIKNLGPEVVNPTIIIKIEDKKGEVLSSGLTVVDLEKLDANESSTIRSFISIPSNAKKDTYTVKVYVWDGWRGENIEALSSVVEASFTVK